MFCAGLALDIDFTKYSVKELKEAWISIDDHAYPDRAIEIYQLLKANGEAAFYEEPELEQEGFLSTVLHYVFSPRISGGLIAADVELENDLARMKEQRVLALISQPK